MMQRILLFTYCNSFFLPFLTFTLFTLSFSLSLPFSLLTVDSAERSISSFAGILASATQFPPPAMKLSDSIHYSLLLLSSISGLSSAYDSSHLTDSSPCVARSPTSGLYFDLNEITVLPPELKDGEKVDKDARDESWHAKGHDYPANFTINICTPVIEDVTEVVGVDPELWRNVSAYYEQEGQIYSIGYEPLSLSTLQVFSPGT